MNVSRRIAMVIGLLTLCGPKAGAEEPAAPAVQTAPPVPAVPAIPAVTPDQFLVITDLVLGVGDEALPGMVCLVHYSGWLFDEKAKDQRGRKFDSSRDRGQPFSFPLGGGHVIKGWERGVVGMRVGGLRRLVIPPALGYGERNMGNGLIPPGSTLLFEVELLAVETVTSAPQAQ